MGMDPISGRLSLSVSSLNEDDICAWVNADLLHQKAPSFMMADEGPACICRCEGLKLPDLKDGYVKTTGELKGHLQATEHRAMMQLVPLALLAAVEDVMGAAGHPIVELVCR